MGGSVNMPKLLVVRFEVSDIFEEYSVNYSIVAVNILFQPGLF